MPGLGVTHARWHGPSPFGWTGGCAETIEVDPESVETRRHSRVSRTGMNPHLLEPGIYWRAGDEVPTLMAEQITTPNGAPRWEDPEHAVAAYYDYTRPFYRLFWHGRTHALHYGFRDSRTRSLADELKNTNRFLASVVDLEPGMKVLDAGCGIGSSALWLAERFDVEVHGISLSERQLERAREHAHARGLAGSVHFERRDFLATGYPDQSFDVFWALESACYAADKGDLVREAHRLLRPGGTLVVGDGVLLRSPAPPEARDDYRNFLEGLVLPNLVTPGAFLRSLGDAGFENIRHFDKTDAVVASSQRLGRRCRFGLPLARVLESAGITPALLTRNLRAGIAQRRLVRDGVAGYSVFRATRERDAPGSCAEPKR